MKAIRAKVIHYAIAAVLFVLGIFSASLGLTLMKLLPVQALFDSAPPNYRAALTFVVLGVISLTMMANLLTNPRLMPQPAA
jgi:H+/Cl- antiporter ClcA